MLTEQDRQLLNRTQNNFPLCSDPFSTLAQELGLEKNAIIERLEYLQSEGFINRFGGVNSHKKMGKSTLAALKVPEEKIEECAEIVNGFDEVNHNYLREHDFNMWFVVTGKNQQSVDSVLEQIQAMTQCELLNLPMVKSYFIDLAFPI